MNPKQRKNRLTRMTAVCLSLILCLGALCPGFSCAAVAEDGAFHIPVSYTHLTLPTT